MSITTPVTTIYTHNTHQVHKHIHGALPSDHDAWAPLTRPVLALEANRKAKYAMLASLLPQIPASLLYRIEPAIVKQLFHALKLQQVLVPSDSPRSQPWNLFVVYPQLMASASPVDGICPAHETPVVTHFPVVRCARSAQRLCR